MLNPLTQYNEKIQYDSHTDYTVYKDITLEIWNRILNNLPYLYKTKGTIRGIKALITCYGIPSSLLSIVEYGGPDLDPVNQVYNEYSIDNFSYAAQFNMSQSIQFDWTSSLYNRFPSAVQFRFLTPITGYTQISMSLVEVPGSWSLSVIPTSTEYGGKIKFSILTGSNTYASVTSSDMHLYDGQFNFVTLQRTNPIDTQIDQNYNLYVKKYNNLILESSEEVLFVPSASNNTWASTGTFLLGGSGSMFAHSLDGSIDELRFWDSALLESTIDSHTKFPQSIIGNYITSSYTDLVLRVSFDDPVPFVGTSSISNESPQLRYNITNLVFYGWTNTTTYPFGYQYYQYPSSIRPINVGPTRLTSNKIRFENTTIQDNMLQVDRTVEIGQYDYSKLDNAKLGLNFNPIELLNENIIRTLAIEDSGNLIGSPLSMYDVSYVDLDLLKKYYFSLYPNTGTIKEYINYIRFYDKSLFEHIKQMIPARTKLSIGIVYESNILERPKYQYKKPYMSVDDNSISVNLAAEYENQHITSENISYGFILSGSDVQKEMTSNILDLNASIPQTFTELNSSNFEVDNIYSILSLNMSIAFSSSLDSIVSPVVDFDTNYLICGYDRKSDTQKYSSTDGYPDGHYKNYLGYNTAEQRQKYVGCLQDSTTTLDLTSPVETWTVDNTVLRKNDNGITKLETL